MTPTDTASGVNPASRTGDETAMWGWAKLAFAASILALSVGAALFSEYCLSSAPGWPHVVADKIDAACQDLATQWMIALSLTINVTTFLFLERRGMATAWFSAFLVFVLLRYAFDYQAALPSAQIPALLSGIVLGKAIALWVRGPGLHRFTSAPFSAQTERKYFRRLQTVIFILVALLTASALWQPDMLQRFQYHGVPRWSGAWNSPNLAGLLMGVGSVLAVGLGAGWQKEASRWRKIAWIILPLLAVILCGVALSKSYSRGAWLGTVFGLCYFAWKISGPRSATWLRRNWGSLAIIIVSVTVLSFWQFRFSEWLPARRLFSVANLNDFSWRNRTVAWEGVLQMMAEHPWFGVSWNQHEQFYDSYYLPSRLIEHGAIKMNDYFVFGATLGIVPLLCLFMYFWLSMNPTPKPAIKKLEEAGQIRRSQLDCMQITCRSGAIVLLVGFWFDGGLLKLATGSIFWILLELGKDYKSATLSQ